ncbi:MAG TPA: hypothetical protein VKQ70_02105 [Caulobacteraceae bacterium]|jgi:hypothetical protein|nr:hypothetical protein [Caulobacteraceae bacterium]
MKTIWLAAAMAVSTLVMQLPASAATVTGIPAPHGVHGIIIHCRPHQRCCHRGYRRHCPPLGIIGHRPPGIRPIGRHPIGVVINHPNGVQTHGIGPAGPTHGGLVNGIPAEQHGQH